MPGIPQQIDLPRYPTSWSDPAEVRRWGESLYAALQRAHFVLAQAINAQCKVDLIANRTATPDFNEIFFYATDTNTLYVAEDGAWTAI